MIIFYLEHLHWLGMLLYYFGLFLLFHRVFIFNLKFKIWMIGGLLPLLFSLPFWFAGVQITKSSLSSALLKETLIINSSKFEINKELGIFSSDNEITFTDEINNNKSSVN